MGRARRGVGAMTEIDPRRLLSMKRPLIAGRDYKPLPPRVDLGPAIIIPSRWDGVFVDADYLDLVDELRARRLGPSRVTQNMVFVLSSESMHDPNSPKRKEYQGHITIKRMDDGSCQFVAVTTNGPDTNPHQQATVYATSPSLDTCLSTLNDKLWDKQKPHSGTRYVPMSGGNRLPTLSRRDFDAAFRAAKS